MRILTYLLLTVLMSTSAWSSCKGKIMGEGLYLYTLKRGARGPFDTVKVIQGQPAALLKNKKEYSLPVSLEKKQNSLYTYFESNFFLKVKPVVITLTFSDGDHRENYYETVKTTGWYGLCTSLPKLPGDLKEVTIKVEHADKSGDEVYLNDPRLTQRKTVTKQ